MQESPVLHSHTHTWTVKLPCLTQKKMNRLSDSSRNNLPTKGSNVRHWILVWCSIDRAKQARKFSQLIDGLVKYITHEVGVGSIPMGCILRFNVYLLFFRRWQDIALVYRLLTNNQCKSAWLRCIGGSPQKPFTPTGL